MTPDHEQEARVRTEAAALDFWVTWRASTRTEWGRKAGPQACGTCRARVAGGKTVEHDECAQRATILEAPDRPGYEFLADLTKDQLKALPPRFHTPEFLDTAIPNAWVCAVCTGDGWTTAWPCETALKRGSEVFTSGHLAEAEQRHLLARVAELDTSVADEVRQALEAEADRVTSQAAKEAAISSSDYDKEAYAANRLGDQAYEIRRHAAAVGPCEEFRQDGECSCPVKHTPVDKQGGGLDR